MAMGMTRSWRSTLGRRASRVALADSRRSPATRSPRGFRGPPFSSDRDPAADLRAPVAAQGDLALGRAEGLHDEDEIPRAKRGGEAAPAPAEDGLDRFAFFVSFKGAFLEGGRGRLHRDHVRPHRRHQPRRPPLPPSPRLSPSSRLSGVALRRPLSRVPENTLKYGVGLLLAALASSGRSRASASSSQDDEIRVAGRRPRDSRPPGTSFCSPASWSPSFRPAEPTSSTVASARNHPASARRST